MVQVFSRWGLGLDITDNVLLPVPDPEIRVSGLGLFWESGDVDLFLANRFCILIEESTKNRVVTLFSGISLVSNFRDVLEVWSKHCSTPHNYVALVFATNIQSGLRKIVKLQSVHLLKVGVNGKDLIVYGNGQGGYD